MNSLFSQSSPTYGMIPFIAPRKKNANKISGLFLYKYTQKMLRVGSGGVDEHIYTPVFRIMLMCYYYFYYYYHHYYYYYFYWYYYYCYYYCHYCRYYYYYYRIYIYIHCIYIYIHLYLGSCWSAATLLYHFPQVVCRGFPSSGTSSSTKAKDLKTSRNRAIFCIWPSKSGL